MKQQPAEASRLTWIIAAIVLVVTASTMAGVMKLGWTNWDDNFYVYENKMVKEADYPAIFTTPVIGNYNPLPIAMFAWEWKQVKDAPWLYHFDNFWMHLVCTGLVFWLMLLLGLKPIWAGLAAMMFGIHPMHVESVAWITERKDVMYGMFYVGALVAYLRYRATRSLGPIVLCFILFVLALLSKIQAVTLPLSMLAIDWYQSRKWDIKIVLEKVPFFIGSLVIGIVGMSILAGIKGLNTQGEWGFLERLALGLSSYCIYVFKSVIPYETCIVYPYPKALSALDYLGIVGAVGIVVGAVRLRKKARAVTFGVAFFTVNIVFLLQIMSAGHALRADRFVYIAYIGLFFAMAALAQQASQSLRNGKIVAQAAGGLLLVVFAAISVKYIPKWKNSATLWSDMIKKYPRSFPLAYVNRGEFLHTERQGDLGLADFGMAIQLSPELHLGYLDRGDVYFELGEDTKAITDYTKVLQILGRAGDNELINDAIAQAIGNRGSLYARNQQFEAALADLDIALQLHPEDLNLLNSRALTYFDLRNFPKAIDDFTAILQQEPNALDALVNRGVCYLSLGKRNEAIADFDYVLQMDPQNQSAKANRDIAINGPPVQ